MARPKPAPKMRRRGPAAKASATPVGGTDPWRNDEDERTGQPIYVEMPVRAHSKWTPEQVDSALAGADIGILREAADLCEMVMTDDRASGVLSTRTFGLLGLPMKFESARPVKAGSVEPPADPTIEALQEDWPKLYPVTELAKLVAWGIVLGVGIAQRIPPAERGIGDREVPTLLTWHPRWLRFQWGPQGTGAGWHVQTYGGEIPVTPGDGQWIVYTPYGHTRPWAQASWRALAFAWILKQFALHDRARASEVYGSPTRVGIAPPGSTEGMRRKWLAQLKRLGRDTTLVLPSGYDLKLVSMPAGAGPELFDKQIEWADRAMATVLAGQFVTTEGTKGFSAGDVFRDIALDLTKFTSGSLADSLHDQGTKVWASRNFGSVDVAGRGAWDVTPPEDHEAKANTLSALGDAVTRLDAALAASGKRTNAARIAEQFSVPMVDLPKTESQAPSIALAPADLAKIVRVNEGRASAGLGPLMLPDGTEDPDGNLTIEEFAAKHARQQQAPAPAPSAPDATATGDAA